MDINDLPLGFAFALEQNPSAMKAFSGASPARQAEILRRARSAASRQEMQALAGELSQ